MGGREGCYGRDGKQLQCSLHYLRDYTQVTNQTLVSYFFELGAFLFRSVHGRDKAELEKGNIQIDVHVSNGSCVGGEGLRYVHVGGEVGRAGLSNRPHKCTFGLQAYNQLAKGLVYCFYLYYILSWL